MPSLPKPETEEIPASSALVVAGASAIRAGEPDLRREDVAECRRWIAEHSRSFYLSSLLLPKRVREGAWALYAFCRRADDAVDEVRPGEDPRADARLRRVDALRRRLDRAAAHDSAEPGDGIDRAYGWLARRYRIPRGLPEALLAGMEADAREMRYRSFDDLYVYCFQVASTVGLMMTQVMGHSRADAPLRASDLGVAMQLTNIARDVGEDARIGRVYLPDELLESCGTDRAAVLSATSASPQIRLAVQKLLARAAEHYRAADQGIALLPRACRPAITASRYIYAAIGDDLARAGHDSITRRAHTSLPRKLYLAARALPSLLSTPAPPIEGPADAILQRLIDACGLASPAELSHAHPSVGDGAGAGR